MPPLKKLLAPVRVVDRNLDDVVTVKNDYPHELQNWSLDFVKKSVHTSTTGGKTMIWEYLFTWTPIVSEIGKHQVSFTATDSHKQWNTIRYYIEVISP